MSWLKLEVLVFMATYAALVGLILIGKWKAKINSDKLKTEKEQNNSDEISVIIPFRNEALNLETLVYAIQQLKSGPLEFIFVNDHSDDESIETIQNSELSVSYSVLELSNNEFGKKAAIRKGVSAAKGKYILTWDADIFPEENFFLELNKYDSQSLSILPVEMRDSGWIAGFFAWDYQLQTQSALSFSGLFRPITASGANLLFEKEAFLKVEIQRTDENVLSGDDQFLLSAFRKSGKTIQNIVSRDLTVITNSPQTIADGLNQRSRWVEKSKVVNDNLANFFGLIVLIIQLTYYTFAFYQLTLCNFGATIVMVLIKGELDAFICTYKFQEQFNTLQVFIYEFLFPVYILALIFHVTFKTSNWKGRSTKKPS